MGILWLFGLGRFSFFIVSMRLPGSILLVPVAIFSALFICNRRPVRYDMGIYGHLHRLSDLFVFFCDLCQMACCVCNGVWKGGLRFLMCFVFGMDRPRVLVGFVCRYSFEHIKQMIFFPFFYRCGKDTQTVGGDNRLLATFLLVFQAWIYTVVGWRVFWGGSMLVLTCRP